MRSCYCTCFCGSTIHQFIGNWKEFLRKPDSYALIDTHGESISDLGIDHQFLYSESDVRKNLNFNHSVSKKHFWNSQGNKNIIWFYAHLRMMNFFLKNPTYDYYWFFDDDVKCNDWYLPSVNEFFAIATNAAVLGISNELGRGYWTSSEYPYSSPGNQGMFVAFDYGVKRSWGCCRRLR